MDSIGMLNLTYENLVKYDVLPESDDKIVELMGNYIDRCRLASILLSKPVDLDARVDTKTGDTMLHKAVREQRINVIKTLLSKGASSRILNLEGKSPLEIITGKDKKVDNLFSRQPAEPATSEESLKSQFFNAIKEGEWERAEKFVKIGGTKLLMARDANLKTAIHIAAEAGNVQLIMQLEERGLEIEAKDKDGRSGIFLAASNGHEAAVMHFLKKGCGRTERDRFDKTPLHLAAEAGHLSVVKLLSHSLDRANQSEAIDLKDKDEKRPIDLARKNKHSDVVRYLAPYSMC